MENASKIVVLLTEMLHKFDMLTETVINLTRRVDKLTTRVDNLTDSVDLRLDKVGSEIIRLKLSAENSRALIKLR